MSKEKKNYRNPWAWVSTLYYAEGIPYAIVMFVSVIMYKKLGISNTDIALYTSWLYLPWVIKPFWSPIVDMLRTKRFWIFTMQLIIGGGFASVALTIPVASFFQYTLAFFWLIAFSSATHDIAADGFYMLGLSEHDQAFYVGIRNTFYRIAMITGQGLLVFLAGYIESNSGLENFYITVNANNKQTTEQQINFENYDLKPIEGELKLINPFGQTNIEIGKINAEEAKSEIARFREKNIEHGFYKGDNITKTLNKTEEQTSWWKENIVTPLEGFIRNTFGSSKEKKKLNAEVGNFGIAAFHLSKKPEVGETIVVNLNHNSGSKNILLAEGSRFEFTEKNWNKLAYAIFQIDPKLRVETEASFSALSGNIKLSWQVTFFVLAILFIIFSIYHKFILPYPKTDVPAVTEGSQNPIQEFFATFALFFKKKKIGFILAFLLLYRLGESQLVKLASPFMLDRPETGGLGLTTGDVGIIYGGIGVVSLLLGGILGGFLASRDGLKRWIWWMLIGINLPNAVYIFLSYTMPESFTTISLCVAIEQFGYGFGFTAYMLYLIYVSKGNHKTAHYAIGTGIMALGMMIPGMISGWIEELIGYQHFFVWVLIATIPSFIITKFIPLDPAFGKKE